MKEFFKEYLSFSKQDRNAVLFLILLIALVAITKFFVIPKFTHQPTNIELAKQDSIAKSFASEINQQKKYLPSDSNENIQNGYVDAALPKSNEIVITINQAFNPNEYSLKDWTDAGFPDKFAKTITNYLSKGGKIRKPEDLKKVYGMKDEWYQKIEPFISLPNEKKVFEKNISHTNFPIKKITIVELNTADSSALESLPLIGAKTASKIIKYRNLLGGFTSINQLKEVWGFKDSMLLVNQNRITIDGSKISKIKINTATFDQLKKHPYLKFTKAKLIEAYRLQHGNYHSEIDLKQCKAFTDDDLQHLLPYLSFE